MNRRAGMTLVEVLVAIFVMGIGLIAILALMPIGILRIAASIRDSKSVSCAINGSSIAEINGVANDPDVVSDNYLPYGVAAVPDLFVNPYPTNAVGVPQLPNADPFDASYPVMADPIGFFAASGVGQHWVGSAPGYLRRRPVWFARNGAAKPLDLQLNIWRNFTLWDDANFDSGDPLSGAKPGTPTIYAPTVPPTIARDTRFSWAYVFRRPQTADRSVVDCSIVVFDQRPLGLTGSLTLAETVYTNTFYDPVKNTILIPYAVGSAPAVRPGNWIMDVTLYQPNPAAPPQYTQLAPGAKSGSAHAYFYRVVAADDVSVGGQLYTRYEVQQPIRGFTNNAGTPIFTPGLDPTTGNIAYLGTSLVIEGIAEVFEKGSIRLP